MRAFARFLPLLFVAAYAGCAARGGGVAPAPPGAVDAASSSRETADTFVPCRGASGGATCNLIVHARRGPTALAGPDAPSGYSPADLQAAYNLPSATQGSGQIVAIVDAFDDPNAASDLATYRSYFGLPAANFTKYNQEGQTSNYPSPNQGWGLEGDVSLEMASASCPNCTLYLVEANSNSATDLDAAAIESVKLGAHIVAPAWSGTGDKQSVFEAKGVTFVADGDDDGNGNEEPAAFPTVVAVGGTTLHRGGGGKRGWTETVWAAGGGCTGFKKPPWQHDTTCATRETNDASALADPNTPPALYDSYGFYGWMTVGGTGVSGPFIAGVFGLAGNANEQRGARTIWQNAHHRYLFEVGDVRYSQGAGWGSPDGAGAF